MELRVWGQNKDLFAREYWDKIQSVFWLHTEVPLIRDVNDWKMKLKSEEKRVIGEILKTFTQLEVGISDHWAIKVPDIFQDSPEIINTCYAIANQETIHIRAYAALNEALGLDGEFASFLEDEDFANKVASVTNEVEEDPVKWIIMHSIFGEGVSLFSSFLALASFQFRNLMKGVGRIIEFSIRDELFHAEFGLELVRLLLKNRYTIDKEFVYRRAKLVFQLEEAAVEKIFFDYQLENLSKEQVLNYIKSRLNTQLKALGCDPIFTTEASLLKEVEWFNSITVGVKQSDFFDGRVTDYAKWQVTDEALWGAPNDN